MPSIYFGYPSKRGGSKLTVETPAGPLEPAEPSTFKIYAIPDFPSFLYKTISLYFGHLVCVLSRPRLTILPFASDGDLVNPPIEYLPFRSQNFGFVVSKDIGLSDSQILFLESNLFTSMRYQNKTVWLREEMNKDLFLTVCQQEIAWDDRGPVPARYLNPQSFTSFLSLISVTTRICETFHLLSSKYDEPDLEEDDVRYEIAGCKLSTDYEEDPSPPVGPSNEATADFTQPSEGVNDEFSRLLNGLVHRTNAKPNNPMMSAVYVNPNLLNYRSSITSGDISRIRNPGKIFKFEPKLASPDINIVADVLGRHFMTALGVSREDQFENLQDLKSGLGALRLTEVGDELSHLYKCIDVAISGQCGLVPFFSGLYYEGCVIAGGHGTRFSIGNHTSEFETTVDLKNEFLTASSHGQSLSYIATKVPESRRAEVLACTSMVSLRRVCLTLELTSDDRDYIIQKASNLRFSQTSWVVSPAKIKLALQLISNLHGQLQDTYPISRVCLFSKDPVLIGLSVFGERSAPSFNIPNGTLCSVKPPNPPSVPPNVNKGSNSKGEVSDASWVMTVRRTDLVSAVEDFKLLAETQSYRSLSSVLAKKQGFYSFSRDRMAEFWGELRTAYRQVNPTFLIDEVEKSLKRTGMDANIGKSAGVPAPKRRQMKF